MKDLAALLANPSGVDSVPCEELPGLIGETEALRARLWARLQTAGTAATMQVPPAKGGGPDKFLTAQEAADRLGVDKRWIYRQADALPFTRKLSAGTLRFSERGLERWMQSRK